MYKLGMAIMNRVNDPAFPKSIEAVITQPGQFDGYKSPRWNDSWNAPKDINAFHQNHEIPDIKAFQWADGLAREILAGHSRTDFGGITHFRSYPKGDEKAKSSGWHYNEAQKGNLVTDPLNDETTTDGKTVMQFYSKAKKKDNSR